MSEPLVCPVGCDHGWACKEHGVSRWATTTEAVPASNARIMSAHGCKVTCTTHSLGIAFQRSAPQSLKSGRV